MAPAFLVSGDGHDLMNRYRTLTLKEIHKLPKLVMIVIFGVFGVFGTVYGWMNGSTDGRTDG